jgi:uncharacterized alpha-E superfamily protein
VRSATLLPELAEDLSPFENLQWMSVLKSLTAYQMYRRVMRLRISRPDVLKFLLHEKSFPRAFFHTLCEVESCLEDLPHNEDPLQELTVLKRKLLDGKPQELKQEKLHDYIDELQSGLNRLNNSISETYF